MVFQIEIFFQASHLVLATLRPAVSTVRIKLFLKLSFKKLAITGKLLIVHNFSTEAHFKTFKQSQLFVLRASNVHLFLLSLGLFQFSDYDLVDFTELT